MSCLCSQVNHIRASSDLVSRPDWAVAEVSGVTRPLRSAPRRTCPREAGRPARGHIASLELRSPASVQGLLSTRCFSSTWQLSGGTSFSVQGRKRPLQCREPAGRPGHRCPVAHEVRGAPQGTPLHRMENGLMGLPATASLLLGWDKPFGLWTRLFLHKTGLLSRN